MDNRSAGIGELAMKWGIRNKDFVEYTGLDSGYVSRVLRGLQAVGVDSLRQLLWAPLTGRMESVLPQCIECGLRRTILAKLAEIEATWELRHEPACVCHAGLGPLYDALRFAVRLRSCRHCHARKVLIKAILELESGRQKQPVSVHHRSRKAAD